jgi:hypothetical protein
MTTDAPRPVWWLETSIHCTDCWLVQLICPRCGASGQTFPSTRELADLPQEVLVCCPSCQAIGVVSVLPPEPLSGCRDGVEHLSRCWSKRSPRRQEPSLVDLTRAERLLRLEVSTPVTERPWREWQQVHPALAGVRSAQAAASYRRLTGRSAQKPPGGRGAAVYSATAVGLIALELHLPPLGFPQEEALRAAVKPRPG